MDVIYISILLPQSILPEQYLKRILQESEEKIVQRLQDTTLVFARLPCAHCLAVLSAHFIVACLFGSWYVPSVMHGPKIYFVLSFAIFL